MLKPLGITMAIATAFSSSVTAQEIEQVVVTGSNIRTTQKEGASAVQVISAKELAASGKTNIADFIRTISANSGNSYNEQYTGSFSAGTAGLSLRGLGEKNTLILVNGKRVSPYATAHETQDVFVDLNSLPMAAVQRIEVLKDGASSIYGSDAVAGVVNIILYKEFKGTQVSAQYGGSLERTGQSERSATLQTGFGSLADKGWSVVFSVDALQRDTLEQSDVDWMRSSDFRQYPGGTLQWTPTNYVNGNPNQFLGGLQGPLQRQPYGAITPGKTGEVLAYNPAPYRTLIPGVSRVHTALRGTLKLNEQNEVYGDVMYSHSRADETFSSPLTVGNGLRAWNNASQKLDTITVALPVGNPNNPGTTALPFNATLFDLGPRNKQDKVDFFRVLAGVKGTVGGWDYDASIGQSGSELKETVQNFVNRYEFEKVLADGSYDFINQSNNSEAVRNRLRLSTLRPAKSRLTTVDASATRELFQLPAGAVGFAMGGQWRREEMNSNTSTAVLSGTELRPAINIINGERDVAALFAELSAPLAKDVTLNLAGRADHYSDFGRAFSPKASVRWGPAKWLLVRGTASRGFRAPSMPEITNSTTVSYGSVVDPRDPISPTQARGVTNLITSNPNIQPERSTNLNAGFVIAPTSRTSIGVDFYRIRTKGVIDTESADNIIANEFTSPGKIVRGTDGRILTLYRQYANQGDRVVSGFDVDVRHVQPLDRFGKLTVNAQLSRVLQFRQPLSPNEPLTEGAGTNYFGSIPKWRGVTGATWDIGAWSNSLVWTYSDGYEQTTGDHERVKPWATVDLASSWKLSPAATISFIVQNLANRRPSWDSSQTFFDITQGDPRGRTGAVRLAYAF